MTVVRKAVVIMAMAGLLCVPGFALAQSSGDAPQHVPLQKTIGQGTAKIVPSLIVMHSRAAALGGNKLTLTGVAPNSIVFAGRPMRAAGHALLIAALLATAIALAGVGACRRTSQHDRLATR